MTTEGHPIDLDHLNRYTGGDAALNEQILRLFEDQCSSTLDKLEVLAKENGAGSKSWHELAHTLKGAARGVGAFALGDVAAEAEKVPADRDAALEVLHRLRNKSMAVQMFIEQALKSS
jgi:HPt (histidine-containing phosphotransfer) domain-containing protein